MIACDDENCSIVWFHLDCLKIDKIPDGDWFCLSAYINTSNLYKFTYLFKYDTYLLT